MEGPFDKLITFVTVADPGEDVLDPEPEAMPEEVACLGGRTLGSLLQAEYEATSAAACARMGRMNCTLALPDLSPQSVGELLMFFQLATGYAGAGTESIPSISPAWSWASGSRSGPWAGSGSRRRSRRRTETPTWPESAWR